MAINIFWILAKDIAFVPMVTGYGQNHHCCQLTALRNPWWWINYIAFRPPKSGKMSVTNLLLSVTNSKMDQAFFFFKSVSKSSTLDLFHLIFIQKYFPSSSPKTLLPQPKYFGGYLWVNTWWHIEYDDFFTPGEICWNHYSFQPTSNFFQSFKVQWIV